jgi:uncharacterized membrane protein YeaQ/YmgE (transglycosylase-associated protein family)
VIYGQIIIGVIGRGRGSGAAISIWWRLAAPLVGEGGGDMFTSLIIMLLIGLIAGWLAGKLVEGSGFGLVGDVVVGVVGAVIAGLLFPALGLTLGGGIIASIIWATLGAVLLLFVIRLIKRGG